MWTEKWRQRRPGEGREMGAIVNSERESKLQQQQNCLEISRPCPFAAPAPLDVGVIIEKLATPWHGYVYGPGYI